MSIYFKITLFLLWRRGVELNTPLFYLLVTHVSWQFWALPEECERARPVCGPYTVLILVILPEGTGKGGGLVVLLYNHMATFGAANATSRINKCHICFGKGQYRGTNDMPSLRTRSVASKWTLIMNMCH